MSRSFLKMRPVKQEFIILEGKSVECYQEWEIIVPREVAQILIFDGKFHSNWSRILGSNSRIKITTKGLATCDEENAWDVEFGKHLAESKASLKAYKKYDKITRKITKVAFNIYGNIRKMSVRNASFIHREMTHIFNLRNSKIKPDKE